MSTETLGETMSPSTATAARSLSHDVDAWIDQNLPRWEIYTAGPNKHYVRAGVWEYYSNPYDLDDNAAVIAVPRGHESDPGSWVRFSATRFLAEGDRYLFSLLDNVTLLDLVAIEKALEDAPDDPPILHAEVGSAVGRLEDGEGNGLARPLPPEWWYSGYGYVPGLGGQVSAPLLPPPGSSGPSPWAWPPSGPRQAPAFRSTPRTPDPWPRPNTPPVRQWRKPVGDFFQALMKEFARVPDAPADTVATFRHSPNCHGWCTTIVEYGPWLIHGCEILALGAEANPGAFAAALAVPVGGDVVGGLAAACAASGALKLSVQAGAFAVETANLTGADYCHHFCLTPTG